MKRVPLFESKLEDFVEDKAEAIISHYFPGVEPNLKFQYGELKKLGDYYIDKDKKHGGAELVMLVINTGNKHAEIVRKLETGYDEYAKYLADLGATKGYNVEILSTEDSINYSFTKIGKR